MLSPLEKYVLDLAVEDYTSIADVFVSVRAREPGKSDEYYIAKARELVRKLLRAGYVRLYYDNLEASTETHREARELTNPEVDVELARRENWIPSPVEDRFRVALGATEEGEEALHSE